MTTSWQEFTAAAPRVAAVFMRRHKATGNLCMLGTIRADGFPRVSPVEPLFFDDRLVIIGMPGTRKFADLRRNPRFSLHTATVDTHVGDGDAKLWGTVTDIPDKDVHTRFAETIFAEGGHDLRGEVFDHFFVADLHGASSIELLDDHLDITVWKPGQPEAVIRKH